MPFNPFNATNYNVDEYIEFIKNGDIEITDINNLRGLNTFSVPDLLKFLNSGVATFEDFQACGLNYQKQAEIKETLAFWKIEEDNWQAACQTSTAAAFNNYIEQFPQGRHVEEAHARIAGAAEDEVWNKACKRGTIEAYQLYLSKYKTGRYTFEAEEHIIEINNKRESLMSDLLSDMIARPWAYTPATMTTLFDGVDNPGEVQEIDVPSKFLHNGLRLKYDDLLNAGIIPPEVKEIDLKTSEFFVPQFNNFDNFPLDRTDIYFLGVPRSGKSSVLAGLFHTMNKHGIGQFVPNIGDDGRDRSMEYYNGLIKSIASKKPPVPTAHETISYINIDIPKDNKKGTNELNFVEISGECFMNISNVLSDAGRKWEEIGASRCLKNNNRKVMFFLLDYNVILGNQVGWTAIDQQLALQNSLAVFTHDGTGKNHESGCTMSKVDTVAVILTKCDLMNTDVPNERMEIANQYLRNNFMAFMNQLKGVCERYGCNEKNDHSPYVITFSLGQFYIGNTMMFDETDSVNLANFISTVSPSKKQSGWGRLFG